MTIHRIRTVGNPALHTPSRVVNDFGPELRLLSDDMFETMYAAEGVGLAANQIGINLRMFVYDCPDANGGWHRGAIVNPQLRISTSEPSPPDAEADLEGCLSVPDERFPTGRSSWASVTGFDLDGKPIEVFGNGTLARCFQHETDHLEGHLYLDRLVDPYAEAARKIVEIANREAPAGWQPELPEGTTGQVTRNTIAGSGRTRGPLAESPVRADERES